MFRNLVLSLLFFIAWISAYNDASYYSDSFSAFFIGICSSYFSFYFLLAWIVVGIETWFTHYQIIAKSLLRQNFNPNSVILSPEVEAKIKRNLAEVVDNEGIVFIWEKVLNGVNSIFSLIMSLYLVEILNREILAEPPHNSY